MVFGRLIFPTFVTRAWRKFGLYLMSTWCFLIPCPTNVETTMHELQMQLSLQLRKNNAFTPTQTSPAGHAIASVSLQLFPITLFRALQSQRKKPLTFSLTFWLFDTSLAMSPRTLLSFALAAADHSDGVLSIRGIVTRRIGPPPVM